jgi:LmbE family N-acetylglucosaminyl deacetylase
VPQPAHRFPNGAREVTRPTRQRNLIVTIPALLLITATASAAEPRVHRDLPYAEPKNERQTLDIYAPTEGTNHPVAVWIHGGGWNLYWYEVGVQTKAFRPDLYLDVESLLARKKEALECHRGSLQLISHPDPDRPWRLVAELQRRRGAECGIAHAEAFALVESKAGCPLLPVPFLTRRIQ